MAKAKGKIAYAAYIIVAVVVVWLFAFGGVALLQGILFPSGPTQPGPSAVSSSIDSISAGGTASVTISSDRRSASIGDSSTNFGGTASVTIVLTITHKVTQVSSFQVSVDDPVFVASGGGSYPLVEKDATTPYCPSIAYTNTGGDGVATTQPCGFAGQFAASDAGMSLSMALTMNTGLFTSGNPPAGTALNFVIHVTGAPDITVTWQVTG